MTLFETATECLVQQIKDSKHLGTVLGVFESGKEFYSEFGFEDYLKKMPISKNNFFEIGSITKPIVGLLFAKLHIDQKLELNTPIGNILPDIENLDVAKITIKEILTHSSGLPRLPSNLRHTDELNPYADYTTLNLYEDLSRIKLEDKIYCYSNLGFALLGEILSTHLKSSLNQLLEQYVFKPLDMNDTFIDLSDEKSERLSEGHLSNLAPVRPWSMNIFSAAGEIKSNITDVLKFARSYLRPEQSGLGEAIKLSMDVHYTEKNINLGLAWHISSLRPKVLIHEGGTYGFRSLVLISPEEGKGLVVLSNTASDFGDISKVF
jgi:D-alanyl-D-alanine-carboxypeptidase/D-alanyl-D-alanine-endopeptidase